MEVNERKKVYDVKRQTIINRIFVWSFLGAIYIIWSLFQKMLLYFITFRVTTAAVAGYQLTALIPLNI